MNMIYRLTREGRAEIRLAADPVRPCETANQYSPALDLVRDCGTGLERSGRGEPDVQPEKGVASRDRLEGVGPVRARRKGGPRVGPRFTQFASSLQGSILNRGIRWKWPSLIHPTVWSIAPIGHPRCRSHAVRVRK